MKLLKIVFGIFVLTLVIMVAALYFWLINPADKTAWRIPVNLPIVGTIKVRTYAILELMSHDSMRPLLHQRQLQTRFGNIRIENQAPTLVIHCQSCTFLAKQLSPKPIQFDWISLTWQKQKNQISGTIKASHGGQIIDAAYSGQANMQGMEINWELPATAISKLIAPFAAHSPVVQQAIVEGTFAANGTLSLPSKIWTAKPEIQHLQVSGLDLASLDSETFRYQCPKPTKNSAENIITAENWQDKSAIGRWLTMAVLIAEDAEFMHHPGYDINALNYILGEKVANKTIGGSTISQQLVKYLFTDGKRHLKRKIEELLYTIAMENKLTKARILNIYLNTVDWGPNICGAYQAAQYYFAVEPKALTPIQAAWLGGILRAPHNAWQHQYKTNQPDIMRIESIVRFMPEKVRQLPIVLDFAYPKAQ